MAKKKKGLRPQASGLRPKKKAKRTTAKAKASKSARAKGPARKRVRSPKREARSPKPRGSRTRTARPSEPRWVSFVKQHGVVLASAHGVVPCLADEIAGERIVGSWWAHPKAQSIFDALSDLDDSPDVRCFKLIDGKVTLVHRRVWPALVALAHAGALDASAIASVQQEHLPTGEHRNLLTPFPEWVDDPTAAAASTLTPDAARSQLPFMLVS